MRDRIPAYAKTESTAIIVKMMAPAKSNDLSLCLMVPDCLALTVILGDPVVYRDAAVEWAQEVKGCGGRASEHELIAAEEKGGSERLSIRRERKGEISWTYERMILKRMLSEEETMYCVESD